MTFTTARSVTTVTIDPKMIAYSNARTLLAQTVPFFSIALLIVSARCYVRAVVLRAFGKDDWVIILAMVRITSSVLSLVSSDYTHIIGLINGLFHKLHDRDILWRWQAYCCHTVKSRGLPNSPEVSPDTHDHRHDWDIDGQSLGIITFVAIRDQQNV